MRELPKAAVKYLKYNFLIFPFSKSLNFPPRKKMRSDNNYPSALDIIFDFAITIASPPDVYKRQEYTKAEFGARANRARDVEKTLERLEAAAEGAAKATGCQVKCTRQGGGYKDTVSNQVLSKRAAAYVEEQG